MAHFRIFLAAVLAGFLGNNASAGEGCKTWFKKSRIERGERCMAACTALPTEMATFSCPSECKSLCTSLGKQVSEKVKKLKRLAIASIVDLYPALTDKERELATNDPDKALEAYWLSHQAERLCMKMFTSSDTNDESDACRHFVWAALLRKELGSDFASKVLDAHELDPLQDEREKAMDLANNRAGLLASEKLLKLKTFSEAKIVSEFKEALRGGSLIIIRRKLPGGTKGAAQ